MSEADREKWDARWADATEAPRAPAWLDAWMADGPREGRALDLAAGTGRFALSAARAGLDAHAVDVSPVGLEKLRANGAREGLHVSTHVCDLDTDPLPAGEFAWIGVFHFLDRRRFAEVSRSLAPGGRLIACIATETNLERHARPSRRFLLARGELPRLFPELRPLRIEEGWVDERHLARGLFTRDA